MNRYFNYVDLEENHKRLSDDKDPLHVLNSLLNNPFWVLGVLFYLPSFFWFLACFVLPLFVLFLLGIL